MSVKLYYTSVSSNVETKKHQQKMEWILGSKKIEFQKIDIAASEEDKAKMREIVGDPKALAPQIAIDDTYCGDYTAFDEAVESEALEEFLKGKKDKGQKEEKEEPKEED
ncbi:SH3 domain-binding glutamic acid-rich-like protein 3 [Amphiura filiformis]|uniref:SH3 domain-binding glutamic acid-rich-like protein 3 n=1 Tax=Amphiura filiformis TaxID=82378 RepID=UPI003B21368C